MGEHGLRPRLADTEIWRKEDERFYVIHTQADEHEFNRSRLADREIRRQEGEGFFWLTKWQVNKGSRGQIWLTEGQDDVKAEGHL
jgi:hypothetical protein